MTFRISANNTWLVLVVLFVIACGPALAQTTEADENPAGDNVEMRSQIDDVTEKISVIPPQAQPIADWLRAANEENSELLKSAFSKRMNKRLEEQGWQESLQTYHSKFTKQLGAYSLSDFTYSYEGDETKGKVTVYRDGRKLKELSVVFEDGAWKADENWSFMTSLIPADSTWLVWAALLSIAAFAFISEQKWKWAQTLTSAIVGIFGAMLLANLRVIPTQSPVYGTILTYILPLSIPLLLFKCDLKKIIKESGTLFLIMNISIAASCLAGLFCGYIFRNTPGIKGIVALIIGAYTGGTLNLYAMGEMFHVDKAYTAASAVVVNVFVIFILLFYSLMTFSKWFRKIYRHPHIDEFEAETGTDTSISPAAKHWCKKPISLRDIVLTLTTALVIAALSHLIAIMLPQTPLKKEIIYLVLPALTLLLVYFFPKYFSSLAGAEEMGTLMIMLFFVVVGCIGDVRLFLMIGPVVIVVAIIVIVFNLSVLLGVGKLFKWSLEDIITSSNATIGGPTTAAGFAVNKGWKALVVPGLLVGLYGYGIGNFCGALIAGVVGWMTRGG